MKRIYILTRKKTFRCWAEYIYRTLGCAGLVYVSVIIAKKTPLREPSGIWVIMGMLLTGVVLTFLDAIGAFYEEVGDGSWFFAFALAIVTFMFVLIVFVAAVA